MTNGSTRRVKYFRKPKPGSSRWFRRYRKYVIAGWVLVLLVGFWALLPSTSKMVAPGEPSVVAAVVPAPKVQPDAKPVEPVPAAGPVAAAPAALVAKASADDAPHGSVAEAWSSMGHLQTESGERYSFSVTTLLRRDAAGQTVFQGALLDHQSGKHYTEQARVEGKVADGRKDGFGFSSGGWQVSGAGPKQAVKVAGKDFSLDLMMSDKREPVLLRAPGATSDVLAVKGAGKTSVMLRPRMLAEGTVNVAGTAKQVRGEVWFEHQWGDFDPAGLRWHRFALQLENGAELLLYELFDAKGAALLRVGSHVQESVATALGAADFMASASGNWKSPSSGVVYPMDWSIAVPSRGVAVKLVPVIRHSQFNARATTDNVFWKGAVTLSGSPAGAGFMELGGYRPEEKKKK
ncbi:MAG: secreted hydrolase-like protein [Proteobacteria bacterium]|nr:secreted hydrolase-like protein [Pseudomonadota bacterium]